MTTIALTKHAVGFEDDSGSIPKITFEEPNYRHFKLLCLRLWRSACTQTRVVNEQAILPLHLWLEYCFSHLRAYQMYQFFVFWQELEKHDAAPNGFRNMYYPLYSPSKLKGIYDVPVLSSVLGAIRQVLQPQVHLDSAQCYSKLPVRCTPYIMGFLPDNRDAMTAILLKNGIRAGRISERCLLYGIPRRLNVLEYVHNTFCQGWAVETVDRLEILNYAERAYVYTRGQLAPHYAAAVVGPHVSGVLAPNVRNIPWDGGYEPPLLPAQFYEYRTGTDAAGAPNQLFPPIPGGNQQDLRPWHLEGNMFIQFTRTPLIDLRDMMEWPPFSNNSAPIRTIQLQAAVPNGAVPGAGPPAMAGANQPAMIIEPIVVGFGTTKEFVYTQGDPIESQVFSESVLPNQEHLRPAGQDLLPPDNIIHFQDSQGRQGYIPGLESTWAMFDAVPYSFQTTTRSLRTESLAMRQDRFANQLANQYDSINWPSLSSPATGIKPLGPKPTRSRRARKKDRRQRQNKNGAADKKELKQSNPVYVNKTDEKQSGQGGKEQRPKRQRNRKKKKDQGQPLPSQPKTEIEQDET